MLIGYARTSIGTELLRNQINVLEKVGCTKIFKDVSNDGTLKDLGLCRAQSALKPGDKLVVCKLDRLGRGVKRLISLIAELQEQGCHFQSVDDGLDTTGADGSCLFEVVRRFQIMEQDLVRERTRPGLQTARRLGRRGGRTAQMTAAKVQLAEQRLGEGVAFREVAAELGVSVATLYRWIPASTRR